MQTHILQSTLQLNIPEDCIGLRLHIKQRDGSDAYSEHNELFADSNQMQRFHLWIINIYCRLVVQLVLSYTHTRKLLLSYKFSRSFYVSVSAITVVFCIAEHFSIIMCYCYLVRAILSSFIFRFFVWMQLYACI